MAILPIPLAFIPPIMQVIPMVSLVFLAVTSIDYLDCPTHSSWCYLQLAAIAFKVPSLRLAISTKVKAMEVIKQEL